MKREKMPRKMKKRFKKMMKFFDERGKDYHLEQFFKNSFLGFMVLNHLEQMGITKEQVSDVRISGHNATVKLKGSIKAATITVTMEN